MKGRYHIDELRKCRFSVDYVTPGERGLAWAILLKAVEDGCSKEWLLDIIKFYGIEFDEQLLERMPANKIKLNNSTNQMISIRYEHQKTPKSTLLSMQDGLHVRNMADVAFEE